jgi:hypothetical protein
MFLNDVLVWTVHEDVDQHDDRANQNQDKHKRRKTL